MNGLSLALRCFRIVATLTLFLLMIYQSCLADNIGEAYLIPIIDTTIDEGAPNARDGDGLFLSLGPALEFGYEQRTLLRFDLSALPTDAVISSALLHIHENVARTEYDSTRTAPFHETSDQRCRTQGRAHSG